MELIVGIIIVVAIIGKANKQKKRTRQRQYQAQPNYNNVRQGQVNQNYQTIPHQQSSQGYQAVPNQGMQSQNMAQMQAAMSSRQQELKARLLNRYGTPGAQQRTTTQQRWDAQQRQRAQQYAAQQKQNTKQSYATQQRQDGISHENTSKQMETEAEGSILSLGMVAGENSFDTINNIGRSSELMRQVNDLIVMGYQSNLTFERDFVSEGVALLNGYELGTEV